MAHKGIGSPYSMGGLSKCFFAQMVSNGRKWSQIVLGSLSKLDLPLELGDARGKHDHITVSVPRL